MVSKNSILHLCLARSLKKGFYRFCRFNKNLSKVTYKRKLGKCGSGKELVWRAFPSSFKSLRFPNAVYAVYDLIDELINVSFQM